MFRLKSRVSTQLAGLPVEPVLAGGVGAGVGGGSGASVSPASDHVHGPAGSFTL